MKEFSTFIWISIFAITSLIVNGLGILAIYNKRDWAEQTKEYFMCFAAGILISSALIMTLPEALEETHYAGLAALGGFLFMYFSNEFIKHKTSQKELAFGITAVLGILIHSFMDGVVYTITFNSSVLMGVTAGLGLVAHEFAEGVITFSALLKGGVDAKKAGICAFFVASLTTPVGAFIAYPFVSKFNDSLLGIALGFVAGVLVYTSASHLLPEATDHEKEHSWLAFVLGIAFSLAMVLTGGHSH